ncbi:MAG: hypothetical protein A2845_01405 [Candidatus Lloydbacteria bacterium RIFCSPHIGHO2_01_FULL_49_22]|uniref:Steroid 5-alpha reductase C-terminal domain-containing protein n=1 Tax=Candidatus Lloydbacteria bacterium RIFCSPHIGHO2_01_FULL_49_22 TaxID=1798658 RepID=A0A1G2CXG3_9BACT|nr:MAG: hypothetical protein A2845_01405 [Candidatus Lloydbacteria bacterium RIFCSPHIGHO2_01_FULL_49_22]OGZ09957.1 MAG: hypothetical protein A3C14_04575 [Candidatus Lloydbacteria bacterium RIFCSPHIGHO2_02_FULL_50_18]
MNALEKLMHSRLANILLGTFLFTLWMLFVWVHIRAFIDTDKFAYLVFCVSESLQAILFLFRSMPKVVSMDPFDWLVAGGGTLTPLLLRPTDVLLWGHGDIIVVGAVIIQIIALLSLNRSFALVAANRSIKTLGAYRIVRHPMYASYIFLFSGYFLLNASMMNAGLIIFAWVFMGLRLIREEKLLSEDVAYQEYKKQVKWRLIPFVY